MKIEVTIHQRRHGGVMYEWRSRGRYVAATAPEIVDEDTYQTLCRLAEQAFEAMEQAEVKRDG